MSALAQGKGRPLRFLALVVVGWVVLRVLILWPQTGSLPEAIRQAVPLPSFGPRETVPPEITPTVTVTGPAPPPVFSPVAQFVASHHPFGPGHAPDPMRVRLAQLGLLQFGPAEYSDSPPAPAQTRFEPQPSHWSGSAWMTVRPGSGLSAAPGGQLGGSQAGVRISYLIDPGHRIALFGRFVTPLSGSGREATLGVEWQPTRAPVRIVAEQRFAVDGGKGGPGVGVVAGTDSRIPGGFRLETYGQAGVIQRDRFEPYADGAARATHAIPGTSLSLGGGVWGAAQRGTSRLDLGPSATLSLPVGGQRIRVAVDWRQRVAGDASPGSGIAVTLGSDF